jgi:general stress protein 26
MVMAEERLTASRNYWVASSWPDGRPHAMPVWGIWHDGALWFSSSRQSRKARNLAADPRCVVTTENAVEPVVIEGAAEVVTDPRALTRMLALETPSTRRTTPWSCSIPPSTPPSECSHAGRSA